MSNTYVVLKDIFNVQKEDVLRVLGREKTPNGCAYVKTITRGTMVDIQFRIPYDILENTHYFVAIHDTLFPEKEN